MNLPPPMEYVEFFLIGDRPDNAIIGVWDGDAWRDQRTGNRHAADRVFAWRKFNKWEYVVKQQEDQA